MVRVDVNTAKELEMKVPVKMLYQARCRRNPCKLLTTLTHTSPSGEKYELTPPVTRGQAYRLTKRLEGERLNEDDLIHWKGSFYLVSLINIELRES